MKKMLLLSLIMALLSHYTFSCDTPQNPKSFPTRSGTQLWLVWDAVPGAVGYDVKLIKIDGSEEHHSVANSRIGGKYIIDVAAILPPGFLTWSVAAICSDQSISAYTTPQPFLPESGDCATPGNLYSSPSRNLRFMYFNWDAVSGASYYWLKLTNPDGVLTDRVFPATRVTNFKFLVCENIAWCDEVFPPGSYSWQVATICSDFTMSAFSAMQTEFVSSFKMSSDEFAHGMNSGSILNIFPNPSNGIFSAEYECSGARDIKLVLLDLTGRIISTEGKTMAEGINTFNLNLNIPAGIYFLEVKDGDVCSRMKFMIEK